MFDVRGRWALITGASRGIGRLIALFMAERGCNLILHSRKKENCNAVIEEVRAKGIEAIAVEAELADRDKIKNMLKEIDSLGKDIDIVFNNAGLQVGYRKDYYKTPLEDFDISFAVNFIAPAMICYHFLPRMEERGTGRIINTTSGIKNEPEQAGYSASKAALDKYTSDLANRLDGTDIIISLSDPGWCRTDLGGPNAPNAPESSIPGVVVGAFVNDRTSGRLFNAGDFHNMSLEEAVEKAKTLTPLFK
ncbi:SDR family oxidoreductase [Spirochaetia bacterium 38H-sp]|uniref:SDR family oxidoreductase n=1 Tax=Rarispira pelagica TaxID=3141764 RepID=A0ABU9U947_9SPIR